MADPALGRFVWYELMTTDTAASEKFYGAVVGWGARHSAPPMPPYTMFTRGDQSVAGLMALPPEALKHGARPSWMAYVGTADVDATVRRATEAGARTVMPAMDIPNVGRFAVILDPQGATIAIFTPSGNPQAAAGSLPADHKAQLGDFSWHELMTTDSEAAMTFYKGLFGWEQMEAHDMGPMGVYRIFGTGGRQLGGMFNKPKEAPMPPFWGLYVKVDDVNRVKGLVEGNGGKVMMGPHEVPGGDWILGCVDPLGAMISFHQTKK